MNTRDGIPRRFEVIPRLDLHGVAEAMRALSERAAKVGNPSPVDALVQIAVEQVPSASWASVTMLRGGRLTSEASTHDQATRADHLQYALGSGPGVDAVVHDGLHVTGDVETDPRWTAWGERAASEVGVRSVLALPLHLHHEQGALAGLTIYSVKNRAFGDTAVGLGLVLGTLAASVVGQLLALERTEYLAHALESNRDIGVAVGLLMRTHEVNRQQALAALRAASRDADRTLADVAVEVADTGVLPTRPAPIAPALGQRGVRGAPTG